MAKSKQPFNLFYFLAMMFGIAFTITACAFGLMMLKSIRPDGLPRPGQPGSGLMDLLSQHGVAILAVEVSGLAILSLAAIWLDHVRGRREVSRRRRETQVTTTKDTKVTKDE
jgi:hypothetical protein